MATQVGGQVIWELDVDDKKLKDGLSSAKDAASTAESSISNSAKGISFSFKSYFQDAVDSSTKLAIGITGIATTMGAVLGKGIQVSADLETARQGFITLTGSAEEADRILAMIKKDAAETPFEIAGLVKANQLLTSVTKDGDRSETMLLNIGKALAAMGKGQPELDRIIVNLQQIGSVGHASMIDIKQFAFAGIPIFEMLKEKISQSTSVLTDNSKEIGKSSTKLEGLKDKLQVALLKQSEFTDKTKESTKAQLNNSIDKYRADIANLEGSLSGLQEGHNKATESVTGLEDAIKNGEISFELLEEMFNEAGSSGGKFADAFKNQMGTFSQLASNLKDTINITLSDIVNNTGVFKAVKDVMKQITDFMTKYKDEIIKKINEAFKWAKDNFKPLAITIIAALTPAFVGLAIAVGSVAINLAPFIILGFVLYFLVEKLVASLGGWEATWRTIEKVFNDIVWVYKTALEPAFKELWRQISKELYPELKRLWDLISPVLIPVLKFLAYIILGVVIGAIIALTWYLTNVIKWIKEKIEWWNNLIVFLKNFPARMEAIGKEIYKANIEPWVKAGEIIWNNLVWIKDQWGNMFNWMVEYARGIPDKIGGFMKRVYDNLTFPFQEAWRTIDRISRDIREALDRINPFHRESPSLVDNVKAGIAEIKNSYGSLADMTFPKLSNQFQMSMPDLEGETSQSVVVNVGKVESMQDVDMISREIGYRLSIL